MEKCFQLSNFTENIKIKILGFTIYELKIDSRWPFFETIKSIILTQYNSLSWKQVIYLSAYNFKT